MGNAAMSPETMTPEREILFTDIPARDQPPRQPSPALGPLSGLERAAFFAALRRKADQRIAEFG